MKELQRKTRQELYEELDACGISKKNINKLICFLYDENMDDRYFYYSLDATFLDTTKDEENTIEVTSWMHGSYNILQVIKTWYEKSGLVCLFISASNLSSLEVIITLQLDK